MDKNWSDPGGAVTKETAQKWFEQKFGSTLKIPAKAPNAFLATTDISWHLPQEITITPLWSNGQISTYLRTQQVVIVPVASIPFLDSIDLSYGLVFFRDSLQHIGSRIQIYSAISHSRQQSRSVSTFTGFYFQLELDGRCDKVFGIENGRFMVQYEPQSNSRASTNRLNVRDDCNCSCPQWNPSVWCQFVCFLAHVFDGGGGSDGGGTDGGGTGGGTGVILLGGGGGGPYLGWGDSGGGSGGGGGGTGSSGLPYLGDEIDNTLFDLPGQTSRFAQFQETYMFQMGFADDEFEALYFNRKLFTSAELYFNARGHIPAAAAAIRNNMGYAMSNSLLMSYYLRYLAYCSMEEYNDIKATGFSTSTIEVLRNFSKVGITPQESEIILADNNSANEVNSFINRFSIQPDFETKLNKAMSDPNGLILFIQERVNRLKAFIHLTNSFQTQLAQLVQEDASFISSSGDMKILMRIFTKVLAKRIGRAIPFVGAAFNLEGAFVAYNAGNYWEAAFDLAGAAMDIVPVGMAAEVGWTMLGVAYDAFKAYRPIVAFSEFLATNTRLLDAIIETLSDLDLLANIELLPALTARSAQQFKVLLGNRTVDEFLNTLASRLGTVWESRTWGKYLELTPNFKLSYYPVDGSFGTPAISIQLNGATFKIRLQ